MSNSLIQITPTALQPGDDGWVPFPVTFDLELPPVFLDDHAARDYILTSGEDYIVGRKGKRVVARLTAIDVAELLSDARHYDSFRGEDRVMNFGLCASAKATWQAIRKQVPADVLAECVRQYAAWEQVTA